MEKEDKRLRTELINYFNIESPYTKENSRYLADEILERISKIGYKLVKK